MSVRHRHQPEIIRQPPHQERPSISTVETSPPTPPPVAAPPPNYQQPRGGGGGGVLFFGFIAVLGNLLALKLTDLFGLSGLWSVLVAAALVVAYYLQRRHDSEAAKWQMTIDMLKSRTTRLLSSPNESAEWLNALLKSAWIAALPSLQPRTRDAFNVAISGINLASPIKSIRCVDVDLSDAVPSVIHVCCLYADKTAGTLRTAHPGSTAGVEKSPQSAQQQASKTSVALDSAQLSGSTSWFSILNRKRNQQPKVPAIHQLHPPAVALDAELVLNTTNSRAVFSTRLAMVPFDLSTVLHTVRIQATMRLFAEFNRSVPFPHISRLSATFLEPPEIRFELTMPQPVDIAKLPLINDAIHSQICKFILRNAMFPDWFDVFVNAGGSMVSPYQHHIQHPLKQPEDLLQQFAVEQFHAAAGVLIIEVRLIPRTTTTASGAIQSQPMESSDSWLIFQLNNRSNYEQLDVVRGTATTAKFAFLVKTLESDNLRVEAWSRRGTLSVKVRQTLIRACDLYKTLNLASTSPFSGPNRVEVAIPQWTTSAHLVTTFIPLTPIPLLSLNAVPVPPEPEPKPPTTQQHPILPGKPPGAVVTLTESLQDSDSESVKTASNYTTIYHRRRLSRQAAAMLLPQQAQQLSSSEVVIGGVLFVRIRNLTIQFDNQVQSSSGGALATVRPLYSVVSLNGQPIACSPQHQRQQGGNPIAVTLVNELELIVPPPPNPALNHEMEFAVDVMLDDSPIKALHSFIGTAVFTYKLPTHRADSILQSVAMNATSRSLQVPLRKTAKTTKTAFDVRPSEVGLMTVDLHFRPVSGLDEINTNFRIIPSTDKRSESFDETRMRRTPSGDTPTDPFIGGGEVFELTLIGATDLKLPNPNSLGDIFIKVKLNDRPVHTTRVKPSTLEPSWNEKFRLPNLSEWDRLVIEVWDYDFVSKSSFVGHVTLNGDEVFANSTAVAPVVAPPHHNNKATSPLSSSVNAIDSLAERSSIWLPLAESNGQIEIYIVNLQPQYTRPSSQQQSAMNAGNRSQIHNNEAWTSSQPTDLHLTSAFQPVSRTASGASTTNERDMYNNARSQKQHLSPLPQRQMSIFGSSEVLSSTTVSHENVDNRSFSAENLAAPSADDLNQQGYAESQMLEAALLQSNSNTRVSLIVCLLEIRGSLSNLWRPNADPNYYQSLNYVTIKISKKSTAKAFQVFSTTLAKSRPLPVQEPANLGNFDERDKKSKAPTVVANLSFQLQDIRLDGGVKIVVFPLEINSNSTTGAGNGGRSGSRPFDSPSTPKAHHFSSSKPVAPIVEWACDVRDLLAGGVQELDPGVRAGLPNVGISRRVSFYVCPPDISFVFRVTQVFRQQHIKAASSMSVSQPRTGSIKRSQPPQPHSQSQKAPSSSTVIPPHFQ